MSQTASSPTRNQTLWAAIGVLGVAVVALGKCGSREMNAGSDLDLMTLYRSDSVSSLKDLSPDVFYGRFTQRLIAALSIPTGEGELYEVDMKLRPSGSKGPVAVSFGAFETYHAGEAETWEHMALTRARVVWSSSPDFGLAVGAELERVLRGQRDAALILADVLEMRSLMARERPPRGDWDLKLSPGGFVDIEFAAQYLQLIHGADGGPLAQNTAEVLSALSACGLAPADAVKDLLEAWTLQQNLTQLLKVALPDGDDPEAEPRAFKTLLARAGGARDFRGLKSRLATARKRARKAYDIILPS
jgi:glutamate-ammonia-ligase adenylyltransferase